MIRCGELSMDVTPISTHRQPHCSTSFAKDTSFAKNLQWARVHSESHRLHTNRIDAICVQADEP